VQEWFSNNWLALYGAIVGTIALFINLFRFFHTLKKDKVKLKVSLSPHKNKGQNIYLLSQNIKKPIHMKLNLAEVYVIKVRNIGNVNAYVEDVKLTCKAGVERKALISQNMGGSSILAEITEIDISPKSSLNFNIYLRDGEEPFVPSKVIVTDSTGKDWSVNA
jgi:hypothetical protein